MRQTVKTEAHEQSASYGWRKVVKRVASARWAAWLLARLLPHLDRLLLRLTGGHISATSLLTGLPVIILTTTGARSGMLRRTPLIGFQEDGCLIVIASNFGDSRHPAWYRNLQVNPEVQVSINGATIPYLAREASPAEREKYWSTAIQYYPGYEAYKTRAGGRQIPVIILRPRRNES